MRKSDPRFVKGLRLFNEEEFFECHEVIEDLWLETRDEYRNLYKGVIQAAAALYLFRRGPQSGARGLYQSSIRYLKPYAPRALGLNVTRLIRDMDRYFRCFKDWDGKRKLRMPHTEIPKLQ